MSADATVPPPPSTVRSAAAKIAIFITETAKEGVSDRYILMTVLSEVSAWYAVLSQTPPPPPEADGFAMGIA